MNAAPSTYSPKNAAKALNRHHLRTCAGFYGTRLGGRWFEARVGDDGALEVSDWSRWVRVAEPLAIFHDHNGVEIPLS